MSESGSDREAPTTPDWDEPAPWASEASQAQRIAAEREAMELLAAQPVPTTRVPQTRPAPETLADGSTAFDDLVPWLPSPGPVTRRSVKAAATRGPALGLTAAIALTLLAAFFGWVSAQPFWLAIGMGTTGTATIASCEHGADARCLGQFTAADRSFTTETVRISGVSLAQRHRGAMVAARILKPNSEWAYVGSLGLRWKAGLLAALLCCVLVPLATGVRKLRSASRGARATLWALGILGPLIVTAGVITAALV